MARDNNGISEEIILEFEDNRLLALLCGEHNVHLSRIEQKLGVTLIGRGNLISIIGGIEVTDLARSVLLRLYEQLERGQDVSMAEVDGAIRLAYVTESPADESLLLKKRESENEIVIRTRKTVLSPRSANQAKYIEALRDREMTFGLGPAGTGKTFLAVAMATSFLLEGRVEKIILSRPAVEAGEKLGFLPGDMREKVDPYLTPLFDALGQMISREQTERRIERGDIEIAPLAFMRGRTLSNAFVILDEAQNTTPMQMKMFLTRFGENCRMVVCGDPSQVDLPDGSRSGLADALDILPRIQDIAFVNFTAADVVRHPLVGKIVDAYDRKDAQKKKR
ncbi:PhoH family protein [Emcibacter nanhaiensis]|uniref:PhoH-like protein n=1 Tax=Emcibacter nanhaiensis TaxID=1505037 RepID=A0A501PID1_9PROT|nr:PhoH family protein [Emcibacter nanhaiensis]TPD59761.1 PhoH family protein [Emcibacter nanhaiensis]